MLPVFGWVKTKARPSFIRRESRTAYLVHIHGPPHRQRGRFSVAEDATHHTLCAETPDELAIPQCPAIYDEMLWASQTTPMVCTAHGKEGWSLGNLFRDVLQKTVPE